MTRTRIALLLALPLAAASAAAPAGATAFGATLAIQYQGWGAVSFSGSGAGGSSSSGITLPGGIFSGTKQLPDNELPLTQGWVFLGGNGAGSFLGSPLAGPMPAKGSLRLKGPVGQQLTLIYVPLFQTHVVGSAAASVGLGVGGSYSAPIPGTAFLRWEHTPWTAGMKTLTGVMYTSFVYHVPTGMLVSMNISYAFSNGTAMYTGTDSRTPGGLGQVTLVSPTKVSTNLPGSPQVFVLVGALTLEFVPEPGTLLLLAAGVAALAGWGRRAARAR